AIGPDVGRVLDAQEHAARRTIGARDQRMLAGLGREADAFDPIAGAGALGFEPALEPLGGNRCYRDGLGSGAAGQVVKHESNPPNQFRSMARNAPSEKPKSVSMLGFRQALRAVMGRG